MRKLFARAAPGLAQTVALIAALQTVALIAASAGASAARAESAESILSKRNRVLAPPPKSLRANSPDRGIASPVVDKDSLTVHPVRSYLNPAPTTGNGGDANGPSVAPEQAEKTEQHYQLRQSRRGQKLSQYGFSGERVFGVGFVGAGVYGIFGAEADFSINPNWSIGFGIGTGMAYSTWGLQGRYFFNQGKVSTFAQFGYANWSLGRVPDSGTPISPHHLAQRFFYGNADGSPKYRSVNLVYPGLGVLYQHASGLAMSAQIDYLIHVRDFAGGLTAGVGFYYYF